MNLLSRRAVWAGAILSGLIFGLAGLAAGQSAQLGSESVSGPGPLPGPRARQGHNPALAQSAGDFAPVNATGRVIAKGPGYSIVATSPASQAASASDTQVTDAPVETLREPIICQGERVLNIDNRDIRFEGNAITAADGCELHITNSRIHAGGIAIRARNASVHIENSEIEGHKASIDATGGAQIYVEASTFRGAARRVGQAAIHDLGNNNWQ
ncbi:MAG TPA: hypothetical protein VN735_00265 [Steroidobacteraceae bacterium]|nr:hypothetical protein [Steroidobacteraceae bacterium]